MNRNEIKIIGVGQAGIEVLEKNATQYYQNTDLVVCDIDTNNLSKSSVEAKSNSKPEKQQPYLL
jgi:cell division GTPase FtsZ